MLAASRCSVCQGSEWSTQVTGEVVCDLCGTQSQAFEEENELDVATMARSFGHGVKQKRRQSIKPVIATVAKSVVDLEQCLDGLQCVLLAHTSSLVEQCCMSEQVRDVMEDLWFIFVEKRLTAGDKSNHELLASFMTMDGNKSEGPAARLHPGHRINLSLTFAFCLLACRWVKEPILVSDVVSWSLNGTLVYFNAFDILPSSLSRKLAPVSSFFRPGNPASSKSILLLTKSLAEYLGVEKVPPLNFSAALSRLLPILELPAARQQPCLRRALAHVRRLDGLSAHGAPAASAAAASVASGATTSAATAATTSGAAATTSAAGAATIPSHGRKRQRQAASISSSCSPAAPLRLQESGCGRGWEKRGGMGSRYATR